MRRVPELDGLRGLAIAFVLGFHLDLVAPFNAPVLHRLLNFGWSGVDLFFVLSGFLIGGILLDTRRRPDYFRKFYARRVFRIVPVYAAVLLAYGALWIAGGPVREQLVRLLDPPMDWYSYVTFTNNLWMARHDTMFVFLSPSWSLAIEEQFYLTLPLLVHALAPRRMVTLGAGAIALVLASRTLFALGAWSTQIAAYVLPVFRADALMVGFCCALAVRHEPTLRWLTRTRVLYVALAVFAAAVALTGGTLPQSSSPRSATMTWGLTAIALFYGACLLLAVTRGGRPLTAPLRVRWLCRLGEISYCVYLLHQPFIDTGSHLLGYSHSPGLMAIAATILVAELSWSVLEQPMLRLGHRFAQPARVPVPVAVKEYE